MHGNRNQQWYVSELRQWLRLTHKTLQHKKIIYSFYFNVAEGHQNSPFCFEAAKSDKGGSQFFVF